MENSISGKVVAEDSELAFQILPDRKDANGVSFGDEILFRIDIKDRLTQMMCSTSVSAVELGAILFLMFAAESEGVDQTFPAMMYDLAEPVFAKLPKECRVIP